MIGTVSSTLQAQARYCAKERINFLYAHVKQFAFCSHQRQFKILHDVTLVRHFVSE
jgi:hypothetical protein